MRLNSIVYGLVSTLALLASTVVAPAQEPPAQERPAHTLTFGVYSFKKPTEVVRDFAVATDALAAAMTKDTGGAVAIQLRVFKTYDECLTRFVAGDIDIVRFGPASYVLAKQRQPKVQLLAAEQEDGKKRCKGVIVVRKESPIQSLADLKGHSFAFGDENSTIGRYLAQAELVDAGIHADDLSSGRAGVPGFRYLDRHDKVFKAVEVGDFDAGAVHIGTFEDLNDKGQLREIKSFDNVGKPWVARAGLDEKLVAALRKALLGMTDPATLKALKCEGFLPAADEDFELVRKGMKRAEQFVREQPKPAK
jgi:phosphonate transport system substrate-binding protein